MKTSGALTDVVRATETLRGLVAGLACDYELTDTEVGKLKGWLTAHVNLLSGPPFRDLDRLLSRILADQVVTEDEREELLEWCQEFSSPDSAPLATVTDGIRRLHGFLQGIVIDGVISDFEIRDLSDWLHDYESLREHWPFGDIWELVTRILEDGQVTEDEREELTDFCRRFSEYVADGTKVHDRAEKTGRPWMASYAPVLLTLDGICEKDPGIRFQGATFCFTGNAAASKRSVLEEVATGLGGTVKRNVVKDLDYLVVGALSEQCWVYSLYGRKIETVMANRKRGAQTLIVHENDFVEAAAREGGVKDGGEAQARGEAGT